MIIVARLHSQPFCTLYLCPLTFSAGASGRVGEFIGVHSIYVNCWSHTAGAAVEWTSAEFDTQTPECYADWNENTLRSSYLSVELFIYLSMDTGFYDLTIIYMKIDTSKDNWRISTNQS